MVIKERIFEKDFPKYIAQKGLNCLRCIRKNKLKIIKELRNIRDYNNEWD